MPTITLARADVDRALRCGPVERTDHNENRPGLITLIRQDGCREDWPLEELATLPTSEVERLTAPFNIGFNAEEASRFSAPAPIRPGPNTPRTGLSTLTMFNRAVAQTGDRLRSGNFVGGLDEFRNRSQYSRNSTTRGIGGDLRNALSAMEVEVSSNGDSLSERLGYAAIAVAKPLINELNRIRTSENEVEAELRRELAETKADLTACKTMMDQTSGVLEAANRWRTATTPEDKLAAFQALMCGDAGPLPEEELSPEEYAEMGLTEEGGE